MSTAAGSEAAGPHDLNATGSKNVSRSRLHGVPGSEPGEWQIDTKLALPIEANNATTTEYADVSELVDHLIRINTNLDYVVQASRLSCE